MDPTYDMYAYNELAEKRKSKIVGIILTHYHADYLGGHIQVNLPIIMGPKSCREGVKINIQEKKDG